MFLILKLGSLDNSASVIQTNLCSNFANLTWIFKSNCIDIY